MKKIVVFGATGDTGCYLIDYLFDHLLNSEYEIIAVGKRKTSFFEKYHIKYCSVDITDFNSFSVIPKKDIYAIIVLAGILPARMPGYEPQKYIDINITGTHNILRYFSDVDYGKMIFATSISDLHGYLNETNEFQSDMPIKYKYGTDHTVYAISKTTAVELIKAYSFEQKFKYYIFRFPNIYLYSKQKEYYLNGVKKKIAYRYIIDKAINGESIELWGNPEQKREIVYVKDMCQIICKSIITDAPSGYYNVGANCMVSMKEQIEGIISVFCKPDNKSEIVYCPEKPSCDNTHLDISKTIQAFGYVPQYDYIRYLEDYKSEMTRERFNGI